MTYNVFGGTLNLAQSINQSRLLDGRSATWELNSCPSFGAMSVCVCGAERDGQVCSRECSSAGCWGAADTQCLSCANFSLDDERCVSSCSSLPNIYQSNATTCSRCHAECSGCTNAVSFLLSLSIFLSHFTYRPTRTDLPGGSTNVAQFQ